MPSSCSICGEEVEKNCNYCEKAGHEVCEECMKGWVNALRLRRRHCTCPVCREILMEYIQGYEPGYMWEGTVSIHDEEGRLVREATYERGHMTGRETTWYPTGKVRYVCHYGKGHLHGFFTYWNPDGTVWFSTRYFYGREMEKSHVFDLQRGFLEESSYLFPSGF